MRKRLVLNGLLGVLGMVLAGCVSLRKEGRAGDQPSNTVLAESTQPFASFRLEDQRGDIQEVRFPLDRPLLLTMADQSGAVHVAGWVEPTRRRFGAEVRIEGVADLREVPGFLRGFVRERFAGTRHPVMLDWEGVVAGPADYKGGEVEVLLIGPDGRVLWRRRGAATPAAVAALHARIEGGVRELE